MILSKAIYRFNATPIKIPEEVFTEIENTQTYTHTHTYNSFVSTKGLEWPKKYCRGNTIPDLPLILQSHINKNFSPQKQTHRSVEQKRGPSYKDTQLQAPDFQQRCQKYIGEKIISFTCGTWKIGNPIHRRITLNYPYLIPHVGGEKKLNSKWIKNLKDP